MEFTVGIITFNSERYLRELFESIKKSTIQPTQILIVENGSADSTMELLEGENDLPLKILKQEVNLGHSGGCNVILDNCETQFLIIQDHDTEVDPDTYETLMRSAMEFAEDEIAISTLVRSTSKYGGGTTYGHDLHYLISAMPRTSYTDKYQNVIPTTCVLVDIEKVSDVRFDNELFFYQTDFDFFYRLRIKGYKFLISDSATVLHKEGSATVSARGSSKYTNLRSEYVNRNRLLFYVRNYSWSTLILLGPALALFEIVAFGFALKKGTLPAYLKGVMRFMQMSPQYFRKRKATQKDRVTSDFEIIDSGIMALTESSLKSRLEYILAQLVHAIFNTYFDLAKGIYGALR